jgi:hypothetical protein
LESTRKTVRVKASGNTHRSWEIVVTPAGADVCIASEPAVWPIAVREAALPPAPHDTPVRGRYFSLSLDAGSTWPTMSTSLLYERQRSDRCQEKERA